MVEISPIRTEGDYEQALEQIAGLMESDPVADSPEGERLELLSLLVKAYEDVHYPIPRPDDPVAVILFYLEKDGLTRKDLEAYLGDKARVSDVLNRKRSLSLAMIRRLHEGMGIPADLLIAPTRKGEQAPPRPGKPSVRQAS